MLSLHQLQLSVKGIVQLLYCQLGTHLFILFSKEECLLIQFGQVCTEANAPLYLVDELVKVLSKEYDWGLHIEDICICGRRSFMQHLLKQFQCQKHISCTLELNLFIPWSWTSEAVAPLKIVQLPYYFNPTSTKIINSQLTNLVWSWSK